MSNTYYVWSNDLNNPWNGYVYATDGNIEKYAFLGGFRRFNYELYCMGKDSELRYLKFKELISKL